MFSLLARLYLYKGDWANASTYANNVISMNAYALNPSPQTCFRTYTTNESIFSIAMDGGDNPNTNAALGQHYGSARRADIPINPNWVALFEPTDTRKTLLTEGR